MAIVPKGARKRASKKSAAKAAAKSDAEVVEVAETEVKTTKKSAAPSIPVPMFQAAPEAVAPKKVKAKAEVAEPVESSEESEADSNSRRRRRGGRGRRRGGRDSDDTNVDHDSETDEELDAGDISDASEDSPTGPRRRRRRRAKGDGVTPGETIEEDGVITVVKVREPREPRERKVRDEQGTRPDRSGRNRNRNDRGNRNRNDREPRDFVRRRGTVITESEYLARRENVDRQMLVRQAGDRTQIAVLEDKIMVEHYVNRNSNISYVGNVYLGKVQNVLPSMEAAFVDIGKGRNAVLYAGEVIV